MIYEVNGRDIRSLADLRQVTGSFQEGDAVVVQVQRAGLLRFIAFRME